MSKGLHFIALDLASISDLLDFEYDEREGLLCLSGVGELMCVEAERMLANHAEFLRRYGG